MDTKSRPSVAVLLLVTLTLTFVGVNGQADMTQSQSFWRLTDDEKIPLISEFLIGNLDLTKKLINIGVSLRWLVEGTNDGDEMKKAMVPFMLDALPGVFSSDLFKLVFFIATDEISRVEVSPEVYSGFENYTREQIGKMMMQNPNMGQADIGAAQKDIMTKLITNYKLQNVDKFRAVRRILLYSSARNLLYETNPNVTTVSPQCYSDTMDFMDAVVGTQHPMLDNGTKFDIRTYSWALKMLDSFGKPSGGILKGALQYVGSYDECHSVHAYLEKDENMTLGHRPHNYVTEFDTRFCRVSFDLPSSLVDSFGVDTRGIKLRLNWGMCFPDTCHSDDVAAMFKLGSLATLNLPVHSVFCAEERHMDDDTPALVGLVLLCVLVAVVVLSTLYEAALIFYNNNFAPTPASTPAVTKAGSSIEVRVGEGTVVYENQAYVPDVDGTKVALGDKPHGKSESVMVVGYVHHKEDLPVYNGQNNGATNGDAVQEKRPTPPPSYTEAQGMSGKRDVAKKMAPKLVKAFSMLTNMPKLLNGKKSPNAIHCLHGIRFFSLMWVILGHTYNYGVLSAETPTTANLIDADAVFKRFTFQGVMAGGFAVDTFFLLSGLLVTWLTLKDMAKRNNFQCGYWVMFYVHRFWRLTPLYMIVMMFFTCLHLYLGNGPLWPETMENAWYCRKYWWTNLLYINNLVHVDEMCMGWSWYLSNDMQFYVISPIFLLLLHYIAPVGVVMVVGLFLAGIASAFYFEHKDGGNVFTMKEEDSKYWKEVYVAPWCRVAAYAVGMMLGYIVYKTKRTTLTMWKATVGWLITWGVGLFLCYITFTERKEDGTKWTRVENSFYEALSRPLWAMCVGWIIFACYNNRGGFINSILSWEGFLPLSRLTYAAYLIHPVVMMLHLYSKRSLIYIDDMSMVYLFMGHTVTTFLAAFFFSVACEAPALTLEKFIFRMR